MACLLRCLTSISVLTYFDRYHVSVFDRARPIDKHFAGLEDTPAGQDSPTGDAYRRLEAEIEPCGIAEIGGAGVAVP